MSQSLNVTENEPFGGIIVRESRLEFAPVVLFNGVASGGTAILNHDDAIKNLIRYSSALKIADEPSPAFLFDSRRMTGTPRAGQYDNRWVTFPQDFPSGGRLRMAGVVNCYLILEGNRIADDLAHVLKRWQDAGIEMFEATERFATPLTIKPPPLYRSLYYRWLALRGLKTELVRRFRRRDSRGHEPRIYRRVRMSERTRVKRF